MKTPGPDHTIDVSFKPIRARALFNGHEIADSRNMLIVREAGYQPVYYFPRGDVTMAFLGRTHRSTHCPYKGDASYFTIARDGEVAENAAWSYEAPYPAMELIRSRVAFYPHYVRLEIDALVEGELIRDVVEHTDSGSGRSQLRPWATTVEGPPH